MIDEDEARRLRETGTQIHANGDYEDEPHSPTSLTGDLGAAAEDGGMGLDLSGLTDDMEGEEESEEEEYALDPAPLLARVAGVPGGHLAHS